MLVFGETLTLDVLSVMAILSFSQDGWGLFSDGKIQLYVFLLLLSLEISTIKEFMLLKIDGSKERVPQTTPSDFTKCCS